MLSIIFGWPLIGAFIGTIASQKRGFGTAAGIIGGLLLGPLAILMFGASSDKVRCSECAEWIQKNAKICPHCKQKRDENNEVKSNYENVQKNKDSETTKPTKKKNIKINPIWIICVLIAIICFIVIDLWPFGSSQKALALCRHAINEVAHDGVISVPDVGDGGNNKEYRFIWSVHNSPAVLIDTEKKNVGVNIECLVERSTMKINRISINGSNVNLGDKIELRPNKTQ